MAGLVPAIHVFLACPAIKTWMPATSAGMTSEPALSRLVHSRRCHRPFADDQKRHVFILGAVPMHAIAEVGDKRTGLERDCQVGGIILVAGADPPGVGEHDGGSRRIAARPRAAALWNLDIGCRADAGDEVGAAFLLGAVPMDLGGV